MGEQFLSCKVCLVELDGNMFCLNRTESANKNTYMPILVD